MFELCLFDLDDTLIWTADLKDIREAGKNNNSEAYKSRLLNEYGDQRRNIYGADLLRTVQTKFPDTRFGVFTRAPKSYAQTILGKAYNSVRWDVIVGYEDVKNGKPHGDGIHRAMEQLGLKDFSKVLMVGDSDLDVRSAYNAGVAIALDKTSWAREYSRDNWDALNHLPDMIFDKPADVISALAELPVFQPDLEWALSGFKTAPRRLRFDRCARWLHKEVGGGEKPFYIYTCGRSFAGYESLSERRKWHNLTSSIHDNKDSDKFPIEWVESVCRFIKSQIPNMIFGDPLVVTVIPHRPGRKPRLEKLLEQVEAYINKNPFSGSTRIQYKPALLAYREGVKSNSNDKLNAVDRFKNVRDHLYVQDAPAVAGNRFLVIDDVCTTGASLIYAGKRLQEAGSGAITRLAISMNIGNVL